MIQLIELMILAGIFSIGCIGCVGYIVYIFWYKKAYDYKDKHVIITGGSSGIGLELAKCFYNAGSKVTIVARTKENLILAQNEITKHGKNQGLSPENLMILPLDVSSNQSNVSSVLNKCTQKFGPCDVLINSAGTSVAGAIQDLKDDEFLRMLQLNVLGSIYPTRAVLAGMRSKQGGRIVFLSSQAGQVGLYGYTAYSTSKYALRGFAETLQMEVRPDNIFVSLAFPPDTRTPGYEQEMLTKPSITKALSESGKEFEPSIVARAIFNGCRDRDFFISVGLDGWLLKNTQPGMAPVTNIMESIQSVLLSGLCRFIGIFYLVYWDWIVKYEVNKQKIQLSNEKSTLKSKKMK